MSTSKINPSINLEYLKKEPEGLYFDRKKANINSKDLANEIASFANSNGGVVAVGVTDEGIIEGFGDYGIDKFNECQKAVTTYLNPTPKYNIEIIKVKNHKGVDDNILLFHIEPELTCLIRNNKDEVYCRQGDSSIKLNASQIRSLEYDRKERDFETEIIEESSINDIDEEVLQLYKKRIDTNISNEEVLKARGFLREKNGKLCLTKAGILLFGKNPSLYLPSARVRVIKFEGTEFKVGTEMNIVKDRTFDMCLIKTIEQARQFINSQLREFTYLNADGIFETVPEYPEFAWYEGLVNAVCHRDYSNSGEYILIKLFNDRLEILSPGKLGGFVTLDTMKTKRYSRNPQIARVLNELGLVRELNEGVKRIYSEMKRFYLKDPEYSEPDRNSVLLVLDNNIAVRANRQQETLKNSDAIKDKWDQLNYLEREVLQYISEKYEVSSKEVAEKIKRGKTTAVKLLNKLVDYNLIVWTGTSKADHVGKYKMR